VRANSRIHFINSIRLNEQCSTFLWATFFAVVYLATQILFAPHLPVVMDEFQGASSIYRSVYEMPYRDYVPYKPVLGYWLQSIFGGSYETAAQYVQDLKHGIYFVNALAIALLTWVLFRMPQVGDRWAIAYSIGLLLLVSTFVERSGALRVDMLTIWFGLFASAAFIKERYIIAGLLIGFGFLVSQKIYFFTIAWLVSLCLHWIAHDRSTFLLKKGLASLSAFVSVLAIYILIFGSLTSFRTVLESLFIAHTDIAFGNLYKGLGKYWIQSLERNFLFYTLLITVSVSLLLKVKRLDQVQQKIMVFGLVLSGLCLNHVQPWPYFVPFLLVVSLFMIPLWLKTIKLKTPNLLMFLAIVILVQVGVVADRYLRLQNFNNSYQYDQLELLESSLEDDDYYLAGVKMLPQAKHVEGLEWLDAAKLKKLNEESQIDVLDLLEKRSPEYVLNNYRLYGLPGDIRVWLSDNYEELCGSLLRRKSNSLPGSGAKSEEPGSAKEKNCNNRQFFENVYSY